MSILHFCLHINKNLNRVGNEAVPNLSASAGTAGGAVTARTAECAMCIVQCAPYNVYTTSRHGEDYC